jgi:hypothetical protein
MRNCFSETTRKNAERRQREMLYGGWSVCVPYLLANQQTFSDIPMIFISFAFRWLGEGEDTRAPLNTFYSAVNGRWTNSVRKDF